MESMLAEYGVMGAALVSCWGALVWTARRFIQYLERKDKEHVVERAAFLEALGENQQQLSAEHAEMLHALQRMNGKA